MPAPSLYALAARAFCIRKNGNDPAPHIQLFVRDRGHFRRIMRFRRVQMMIHASVRLALFHRRHATWRIVTRTLLRRNIASFGSLAAIDRTSMRVMRTASRIRLLLQRFVYGLKSRMLRARRRRRNYSVAMDIATRVRVNADQGVTWREMATINAYDEMEEQGGLAMADTETIRDYMFVQRLRYTMQHFVRELQARVAARRRLVERRLRRRLN